MAKLSKILALALGLGLLAAGLISITGRPASAAGAAPVNITQVSVPSVPVSGNVSVSNNPLNVALPSGTSVGINNPASSPVLQRNVDAGSFTEVGQKAAIK